MKISERHSIFSQILVYLGGLFLLLFAFYGLRYMAETNYRPESLIKRTENTLHIIDNQCVNTSNTVFQFLHQKNHIDWHIFDNQITDKQEYILIQRGDSVFYWNNNKIPAKAFLEMTSGKKEVLFFCNKPYFALKKVSGNYAVGVFYPLTNKILPNNVQIENNLSSGTNEYRIKNFHVTLKIKSDIVPPYLQALLFFLYVAIFLYIAILLLITYQKLEKRIFPQYSPWILFSFFADLIFLRVIQYYVGFPPVLKSSFWISGQIINFPTLQTFGDIVLNLVLLFVGLAYWARIFKRHDSVWNRFVFIKTIPIQVILFLLPVLLYFVTVSILQNSGLMLFTGNGYFSMTGIIRLFLLLLVNLLLYLWFDTFLHFFKRKGASFWQIILTFVILTVLFLLFLEIEKTIILLAFVLSVLLTAIIWFIDRNTKPYFHSILTILLLSLTAAYLLNVNEYLNRNDHQRFTANMLTQKRDPYLQYLLKKESKKILKDPKIIRIIKSENRNKEQLISDYLSKVYFHDMLSSYSRQVTLCEPGQQLEIQPDNRVVGCDAFFRELQGIVVDSSANFELSLINNTSESIYYLAKFRYKGLLGGNEGLNLYIEFFTNIIPKGLGYPELLQDANVAELHLSDYSFAFYERGKLEYKFGDFLYPIDMYEFKKAPLRKFFNKAGYTHYMLPVNKSEVLIVSRTRQTLSEWLLPFSLLFILSGVFLLVYVFINFGKQIIETFRHSFSTRLQLTIFSTMLIVFFTLTAIILYYFNANNRQTISNNLKEKTHSVMIALQNKLSPYGSVSLQNKQEIQTYLQKLSMIFFSDINLYDNTGKLIVSSRPEIFSRGLQSRLINPKAFVEIGKNHKLFYLGKEKIQHVAFYSAYAPFILNNGMDAGIINLPYFARQSELQHTYYQMLANLINLFVITGMLGMLIMIYLSRLLTRPLNILQHKITSVSIDKQNEIIAWSRNDEIGKLIEAYNQMVKKLDESARWLKYSAREKAWRDMARQVAHEIRNPLTPMKLNVQYLQKVYAAKDPRFDEKFKMVSSSIISQIDTLNDVAAMFADFSKNKIPLNETADLMKAVESTVTLFRKSYDIEFDVKAEKDKIEVKASMQDLLRIFNNLLKNAAQSMEDRPSKLVRIQLILYKNQVEIRITDNGKGIDDADKEHIFQPYFTTKSKGTGLGLAIVKNLITEIGGEIIFVSEKGLGTTFIIKLPLAAE